MKKIVIYTCLTSNYDDIRDPLVTHDRCDYIYFSDSPLKRVSAVWQHRFIKSRDLNAMELSRKPKLLPHIFLSEYEYSIYIDANIQIQSSDFYDEILKHVDSNEMWVSPIHPTRDCVYEEGLVVVLSLKARYFRTKKFLKKLSKVGFPHHYGLTENNIIIRAHLNPLIISIDEAWWSLFLRSKTMRDQFSLSYIFWSVNFRPNYLFDGKKTWQHKGISRIAHRESLMKKNSVKVFWDRMKDYRMRVFLKIFGDVRP